jgi:hypothetical protein
MPRPRKRCQHLNKARALSVAKCKKTESSQDATDKEACGPEAWEPEAWEPEAIPAAVHWAGVDDGDSDKEEDDCAFSEAEEDEEDSDAFKVMMRSVKKGGDKAFQSIKFAFQRLPEPSKKTKKRKRDAAQQLEEAAMDCRPLDKGWLLRKGSEPEPAVEWAPPKPWVDGEQMRSEMCKEAIDRLEKKLGSAKTDLIGQNLTRHRAVLAFLKIQRSKQLGETREEQSYMVARCFGRGLYFARKIVEWERQWIRTNKIEEGRQGCFQKTSSWFGDEGVQLAVREWLAGAGEGKIL